MKNSIKTTNKVNTTSKNNKSTGCGFVTFSPYISTTPSGAYRVKVGNKTVTCSSKNLAFKTRKRLLAARNA